ncbi:MAG: group II intron reverse transcriptase/maturase [Legionellales bacterium]|nr:group II intron reverse transcriptase/maturase [Legionellales bacterium]
MLEEMTKQFIISKQLVVQAYKLVKANAGSAGVDNQSLKDFEINLKDNLYKIWNRMSSGSYFPPAVKAVIIPKKTGGERILGVPTVSDRIAQMVVKLTFEPKIEPHFLSDSYGYRPNKSAMNAIDVTRQRCWKYDWVLEFDIKGLFDNIPHDLLIKAVRKHTDCKWSLLYIERWLKAPIQMPDGTVRERTCGVPQGGVISPCCSNLFLHYVFDKWMQQHYPNIPWCRYADDGLLHCNTEQQAMEMMDSLRERFTECGLQMHPDKTKIVYCKDSSRKSRYQNTSFDFLGYTFRGRRVMHVKTNRMFVGFNPAVSKASKQSMRNKIREKKWHLASDLDIKDIAAQWNPVLKGWSNYYGHYYRSELDSVWRYFNTVLASWARRKYKKLHRSRMQSGKFIERMARKRADLFVHWKLGVINTFA